jgi:hypothetical protein
MHIGMHACMYCAKHDQACAGIVRVCVCVMRECMYARMHERVYLHACMYAYIA